MQRRGFLKRLAGVVTAAVVSEKIIPDDGVALDSIAHPGSVPFGLAQLKPEGGVIIPYDLTEESLEHACIDMVEEHGHGCLTRGEFSRNRALRNLVDDAFRDTFAEHYTDEDA